MHTFSFIAGQIQKGKSVTRSFLNYRLRSEVLSGKTIDIGGGTGAGYIKFMDSAANLDFTTFDPRNGDEVNFETDALPAADNTYDTVIFLNVMEHIFNYQHVMNEVVRITKKDGQVIGFVPFLMWYHPDHSDYFRYTHEALEKIITAAGVTHFEIEPVQKGLFIAAFHMKCLALPRLLRVPFFSLAYAADTLVSVVKKNNPPKYVLGYFFKIVK